MISNLSRRGRNELRKILIKPSNGDHACGETTTTGQVRATRAILSLINDPDPGSALLGNRLEKTKIRGGELSFELIKVVRRDRFPMIQRLFHGEFKCKT